MLFQQNSKMNESQFSFLVRNRFAFLQVICCPIFVLLYISQRIGKIASLLQTIIDHIIRFCILLCEAHLCVIYVFFILYLTY